MSTVYAAIMAGGTGTRLWPRSRQKQPKQIHAFISAKTLIQETVADIESLVAPQNILVVTGQDYAASIRQQIPQISRFLIEPLPVGRLLAIGLAARYVAKIDPRAVMILLWSDSYIGNKTEFKRVLEIAVAAAKEGTNGIIGVRPPTPATHYGYIEIGKELGDGLYHLASFREKPDLETAKGFVSSGRYVWNPGISVWRVDKLLELYHALEPEHAAAIEQLADVIDQPTFTEKATKNLTDIRKLDIEDTIYARAGNLAVLPADIGWDDVGNWAAVKDLLQKEGNVISGKHIGIDTENCLVHGHDKLIATIGLRNLIVVETDDAILIADKHHSQKVKEVVEQLKAQKLDEYL